LAFTVGTEVVTALSGFFSPSGRRWRVAPDEGKATIGGELI